MYTVYRVILGLITMINHFANSVCVCVCSRCVWFVGCVFSFLVLLITLRLCTGTVWCGEQIHVPTICTDFFMLLMFVECVFQLNRLPLRSSLALFFQC